MYSIKRLPFFKLSTALCILFLFFNGIVSAQIKDVEWYRIHAPFEMPVVTVPEFPNQSFLIEKYGAVGDGQTLNTDAFEKTIAACVEAGGGKVVVTPGVWLTGPIQLKSNINLEVQQGAIILFTKDRTQYPIIRASKTSTNFQPASPIYGYDLKNVAITGEGVIDGGGESWRPVKKSKTTESQWKALRASGGVLSNDSSIWWPSQAALDGDQFVKDLKSKGTKLTADDLLPARDFLRPHLVFLVNCENVLIENVTIRNSPKFIFYPSKCKNVTLRYATFFNEWWAQNGDAIDISACENVVIYKCTVSAGDDGICMKSSRGKSDNPNDFNLQNILIVGCTVYEGHGGFVIGSNTDGGMRNIFVTDCSFIGTDIGIRVKSNAGRGGIVKDIYICNISMADIKGEAISFDTYYEDVPAGAVIDKEKIEVRDKTPMLSDFHISNVSCNGAKKAIEIIGLPEMPINKIYFDNITISANKGIEITNATNLDFKKLNIITGSNPTIALRNTKNFVVNEAVYADETKTFIKADKNSGGVKVTSTDFKGNKKAIQQD